MPFEMSKPIVCLRAEAILRINARSGEMIEARLPAWKQANMTAKMVLLQAKARASWSDSEANEFEAILTEWAWIDDVRARSNSATKAVMAASTIADIRRAEAGFE